MLQVKGLEIPKHRPTPEERDGIIYAVAPNRAERTSRSRTTPRSRLENAANRSPAWDGALGSGAGREDLSTTKVVNTKAATPVVLVLRFGVGVYLRPWTIPRHRSIWFARRRVVRTRVRVRICLGERVATLARIFNIREGFTARGMTSFRSGCSRGTRMGALQNSGIDPAKMDEAIRQFYGLMGWDSVGVPTRDKLEELGIEWTAEYLPEA